jgi:hypothetical protein
VGSFFWFVCSVLDGMSDASAIEIAMKDETRC